MDVHSIVYIKNPIQFSIVCCYVAVELTYPYDGSP